MWVTLVLSRIPSRWELKPTFFRHIKSTWKVEFHPVGNWNRQDMGRWNKRLCRIPSRWELKPFTAQATPSSCKRRIPSRWELKLSDSWRKFLRQQSRLPSRWELKLSVWQYVSLKTTIVEFHPVGNWNFFIVVGINIYWKRRIPSRWELKLYSQISRIVKIFVEFHPVGNWNAVPVLKARWWNVEFHPIGNWNFFCNLSFMLRVK